MSELSDPAAHQQLCDSTHPKLAGVVDDDLVLSPQEQAHVESCLRCQAELVRYRRVLRALHELRTQVIRPAPGLLAEILDNIAEKGENQAVRSLMNGRRIAYAGGIAVAAVAGVTGAVLLAGHARRAKKAA